jgi:putative Holliday junction resolvase
VEQWTRGRRLGIDVGSVRVGVAVCDPDGILASPVATVARDQQPEPDKVPSDMAEILGYAGEYEAVALVVGLPINLAGREGPAAASIRQYVNRLAELAAPLPVVLTDERMSTAAATRRLSERGVRGRRQRAVVDQAAAVEILQGWLDAKRAGAVRG